MDQNLPRSDAWLGNRQCLAGAMAGLLLPARRRRPVVAVMARGSISLGQQFVQYHTEWHLCNK